MIQIASEYSLTCVRSWERIVLEAINSISPPDK
jgi:hypothetical protein